MQSPEPSIDNTHTLFNFDTPVDRSHSDSDKWNKYAGEDILPMWVADTDFRSPPAVIEALHKRVEHGVFGYGYGASSVLTEAFIARMQTRYDWAIKPEWLVFLPGLVCGLNLAVRAFTAQGQRSIAPSPIYPPFVKSSAFAGIEQVLAPVTLQQGRWVMNLDSIASEMQGNEKLLMLCNPQNPGGTIYRREELLAQAEFARQHNLLICSDEIHCDLLLDNQPHIPIAALNADAEQRSITLMAPSKTFNIAGLGASIAIIPNDKLRQQFIKARAGIVPGVDIMAYTAAEAAYLAGDAWLEAQLDYLRINRDITEERVNAMPYLTMAHTEATYLAWIDCSALPVQNPHRFFEHAGIGLSAGGDFGDAAFVRLNFGCTRALLNQALDRMERAVFALKASLEQQ
ncbi:MalY/PatB family protein [Plesiomonas sp.]|uniref:MalY/PatB family protein n=1 Tax=Plesiomonas sp. TaxID=2486279 RepID=UPI003F34A9BF